jgi:histidine triad (HIT) family protein
VTGYDPGNVFARIIRGELPAHKVFEDDNVLCMMDIFPQSKGHLLVIPKAASRNLLDADPQALIVAIPYVQQLARAVTKAMAADGLRIVQFNEHPAGQTVFHLHFHLIPAYEGEQLQPHASGQKADDAELAQLARDIAAKVA